jgi:hypothetical protein
MPARAHCPRQTIIAAGLPAFVYLKRTMVLIGGSTPHWFEGHVSGCICGEVFSDRKCRVFSIMKEDINDIKP